MKRSGVIVLMIMMVMCSACAQTVSVPLSGTESFDNGKVETLQTGYGENKAYPVLIQIYTDEGKAMKQTITKKPERVVVLGSAMAELMIEFGLKDKVIGVGYLDQSFSKYADPIAQLPFLSQLWPSKEAVIALKPDLIFSVSSAFKEDRLGDIAFWNDRGIPVLSAANFTIGRSIEQYFTDIKNFGAVFQIEDKTNAYIKEQNARMDQVKKMAKTAEQTPKVLLIASAGRENYDYYPPSWCIIDEMIEGAGGEYMKLSKDGYIQMSLEAIIAANPEKIMITEFQEPDRDVTKNKLILNDRLKNVNAIKTGNVMVVDYTNAIRGSLELADLYDKVAAFIHPEIFGGK